MRLVTSALVALFCLCSPALGQMMSTGFGVGGASSGPAPVLTSPQVTSFTNVTAALSVDTTIGSGTLYYVGNTSSTPPTATQIAAGQDNTGSPAISSGSQAVSGTGTQSVASATGLSENTSYTYCFTQDASGLQNVTCATAFTTYYTDSQSVFTAFTTPPTSARKTLINANIGCLKTAPASAWSTLDSYQVYAAADSQAATVDWKVPTRIATLTASPTFTADRGFTTNGTSSFVDTLYNPSTGPNFTQNLASVGNWTRTSGSATTSGSGWFDGTDGITLNTRNVNVFAYRMNSASASNGTTPSVSDGSGLFSVTRDTSTSTQAYRFGTAFNSGTATSSAVNNHTLLMGAITASSFQAKEWSLFYAGGFYSAAQIAGISSCATTYMTAVGAFP